MVWSNNWRGRSIATTIEDGLAGQVQEMENKLCSRSGSHKYRWIPTSVSCTLPQIQIWFYRNTKIQYCWNTTYKKQNCQQTAQHATARTLLGIKEITPLGRSGEIFLKSWVNLRYGQDAVVESGLTMKNDRNLVFKRKNRGYEQLSQFHMKVVMHRNKFIEGFWGLVFYSYWIEA